MHVTPTTTTSVTESTLTLPGGQRISYAEQGPPSDTAIVLVHGWPDSWRSFEPVLASLPGDVRAIAVSLPGFGSSDPLPGAAGPRELAAAVTATVGALGISRATLVGHSLGTLLVQRIALDVPALALGLVMIGGFSRLAVDVADEVWAAVADLDDPIDEAFVRDFQASTLAAPVPEAFFDQLVAESRRAPAAVWQSTWAGVRAADHRAEVGRIGCPVLLIWGEHDALVPYDDEAALLRALPDAALTVYAGAGHSPNWEQPERVAADILHFHAGLPTEPHAARSANRRDVPPQR